MHSNIRILAVTDWEVYRTLRLCSLKDSPDSFGSTYEREAEYADEEWQSRLDPAGRAANTLPLLASVDDSPSGLAWGLVHDPDPSTAYVYQMWVAPEARGRGLGRALLDRIVLWAGERKLDAVSLTVTTTNTPAIALYASLGFVPDGETKELRPGSPLSVQPMVLRLGAL